MYFSGSYDDKGRRTEVVSGAECVLSIPDALDSIPSNMGVKE